MGEILRMEGISKSFPGVKALDGVNIVVGEGEVHALLGENGAVSDGLSTACFVLGKEKGAALLEEYGAEGIFVDQEKNVYVTDDLMEDFRLEASGYVVFPLSP